MKFKNERISARVTAFALALGLVGVLVTALPASAASITSFSPTCGVATNAVTITGVGFNSGGPATAVRFNGTNQPTFTVVNDNSITTTVPAGATTGPIAVDAPTGNTVSATNFIVAAAATPTIISFAPASGAVGSSVVITGTNFGCTTSVLFNTTAATSFTVNSASQITATVPVGATSGLLHVTTSGGGPANSATSFTVIAAPTITSFAPTSGPVGTSVVITGTNLTGVTSVKFNGTTATFTPSTATSVTATVPAGATTGPIVVTNPGGTATSSSNFTVTPTTITSFSPTKGPVGTTVVITGTGFTGVTSVKFNGTAAVAPVTNSTTSITAIVPVGATTGPITVVDAGGTATSTTSFTVTVLVKHNRTVTLALKKHLIASGTVHVADGFNACRSDVTVKIQRLVKGVWKSVGTDQTSGNGKYKKHLKDKTGKYRAIAKKEKLNGGTDVCVADTSAPRHHHH